MEGVRGQGRYSKGIWMTVLLHTQKRARAHAHVAVMGSTYGLFAYDVFCITLNICASVSARVCTCACAYELLMQRVFCSFLFSGQTFDDLCGNQSCCCCC